MSQPLNKQPQSEQFRPSQSGTHQLIDPDILKTWYVIPVHALSVVTYHTQARTKSGKVEAYSQRGRRD